MAETKILVSTTQTLLGYPMVAATGEVLREVPTSVEVQFGTPAVALAPATFVSATVDAVNTTLSALAAEGATSLTIASAAIKRGRQYLVADGDGGFIVVESRTEGTSTTMRLAEPLPRALASGAAVKGFAVSKALTTAQTALVGEGVARWKAVLPSQTVQWSDLFTIVERMPRWTLTPTRLTQAHSSIRALRSRQDPEFEEIINATLEHRIRPLLAARGIREEDIHSAGALEPLHALACMLQLATTKAGFPAEMFERLEKRWDRLLETTFASNLWHTQPQDAASDPRPADVPSVALGIRLVR